MERPVTPSHWRFWSTRRTADSNHSAPETLPSISPHLEIVCCGAFASRYDGRNIVFARSRKARELLAFLATRPGMSATCDEAVTALWPDAEPDRARRLLINAAWRIRYSIRACGLTDSSALVDALRFEHGRYSLDVDRCDCDLARFRTEQARSEAYLRPYTSDTVATRQSSHEAQRLLELDLLVTTPLLVGESYDWLPTLERQIRELRLTTLRRALRLATRGSAHDLALSIAERILTLDMLDEPTTALTMRLHLARGDSAAAATIYRAFRLALARRYGSVAPTLAQPSHELQALFAQAAAKDGAARESASLPPTAQAQAPPT